MRGHDRVEQARLDADQVGLALAQEHAEQAGDEEERGRRADVQQDDALDAADLDLAGGRAGPDDGGCALHQPVTSSVFCMRWWSTPQNSMQRNSYVPGLSNVMMNFCCTSGSTFTCLMRTSSGS